MHGPCIVSCNAMLDGFCKNGDMDCAALLLLLQFSFLTAEREISEKGRDEIRNNFSHNLKPRDNNKSLYSLLIHNT
ncbi:hypothetical protein QVD17_36338 [Tagetes erecta]|uniref:Uncharacterized protein n=1 Tax=Tagetes erecta TaxID=13708 RepID=A0AAD8JSA2_TARER|nr:hypothetical protein QVD17_36338 [Tagetes erecta]